MSYPIKYPTPQGANVQIFQAETSSTGIPSATWVKPQGASFVFFTLIGAGGGGDGLVGGGSAAVTNFMCPAFLIPDSLVVVVARGTGYSAQGQQSQVLYRQKAGTGYTLLSANGGDVGGSGGIAMTANYFTAMGFFQSIAGQGGAGGDQSASTITFLSGGAPLTGTMTANYGYSNPTGDRAGFFQTQPIIVGVGGQGTGKGGVGCGGGANGGGGPGIVVIITW